MLVLSRKSQEVIVIGGGNGLESLVRVTVLEIRGGSVKLGFEADGDIPIHRGELRERLRAALESSCLLEPIVGLRSSDE